jgi:hypothetical protein
MMEPCNVNVSQAPVSNALNAKQTNVTALNEPGRTQVTDDLNKLLNILPNHLRDRLQTHPQRDQLVEVVMDLGRRPEARFPGKAEYLSETPITHEDLQHSKGRRLWSRQPRWHRENASPNQCDA